MQHGEFRGMGAISPQRLEGFACRHDHPCAGRTLAPGTKGPEKTGRGLGSVYLYSFLGSCAVANKFCFPLTPARAPNRFVFP